MQRPATFRLKLITILVASALNAPHLAAAENKVDTLETGTVDVVGTTPLSTLGIPIEQVPSNVQVAKGRDIQEQHGLTLADFLNQNLSGVNINETQNNPYQPDVNFHGFSASPLVGTPQGISVYQDGVRVNEPFGDTVNWDLIPQNAIAGITLIPGSNPLFGLNTLGGALSVQTKSGEHFQGGGIQLSGGSFGRAALEAEFGNKLDNGLSYFFAGNVFHEDGWRDGSPSEVRQGFGKIGWQDEKTDVDISFSLADNNLTGNGYQPQSLLNSLGYSSIYSKPDNTQSQLGFLNGKASHWFTDALLLTANAYYRHNSTHTFNGDQNGDWATPGDDEGVINRTHVNQDGYGGALQLTWVANKNQLVAGISYDGADINFNQSSQLFSSFDATRGIGGTLGDITADAAFRGYTDTWSIFATDTYNLSPKLALTLSGRYNNTHVSNQDQINPLAGSGSLTGAQTFERFNPAVGLAYSFSSNLNVYGGYNEGNRAPSSIEIGCSDPDFPCNLPNAMAGDPPVLKQVVARTFEGGVRGKLGNIIKWNIAAYHTRSSDDLQFIASNSSGAGYFSNVGDTRRYGIDLGINGETGDFRWSAGYSFIRATYESSFDIVSETNSSAYANASGVDVITVKPGDNIPGIPRHQLKLRAEWRALPTWTIGANAVLFSDQYARGNENNQHQADGVNFFGSGKVAGYAVLNLDTRYNLPGTGWNFFAKVNNVLDSKYYSGGLLGQNGFDATGAFANGTGNHETFLAPGAPRAGWVGLRYEFGGKKVAKANND
ncbi:MAG: TonB-dependent receptor [Methylophilaceae bacterium]|nr:TonB-dependent receptor [Methylophilaceae bacterium]